MPANGPQRRIGPSCPRPEAASPRTPAHPRALAEEPTAVPIPRCTPASEQAAQVRILADAYGLHAHERGGLIDAMLGRTIASRPALASALR
ncbi:hypothetical protein AB4Z54_12210 [Streptomyces sp. MCAF7]